jgi:uncharacterized membrane protein YeaQ/YmgE (transglycosylase-associated protein family)
MIDILLWIIFGGIVGWLASIIMKTDEEQGVIANIFIGIVGALIGGFIARNFLGQDVGGFNILTFLVALGGALLLIFIGKILFGNTRDI